MSRVQQQDEVGTTTQQSLRLAAGKMNIPITKNPGCVMAGSILPGSPPQPCPELLTEEEAIRYLRLDTVDIDHPDETLRRYRSEGLLRGTQVSKRVFYRRVELERFLDRVTESNPR